MIKLKIAFLLTIYTQPKQVNMFIKQILQYEKAYVFIHIDEKYLNIKEDIIKHERVVIIPNSIKVEWGDFSHSYSIIELMKYAKEYGEFDYFSVNSGHDLLIKPVNELIKFLEQDNAVAYLDCNKMPCKGWELGGGMGRIQLNWPSVFRQKLTNYSPWRYIRKIYGLAYEIGIIKGKSLPQNIDFYGGSDWFTVRNDALEYMLNYIYENHKFIELFDHSLIGSEIFFNTLICNMDTKDKIVTNNNLRYIDWSREPGQSKGSPKTMNILDLDNIIASDSFVARKFDINKDVEVINKIISKTI